MVPPAAHDYGFLSSMLGAGGRAHRRLYFSINFRRKIDWPSRSNDASAYTLGIILDSWISYRGINRPLYTKINIDTRGGTEG